MAAGGAHLRLAWLALLVLAILAYLAVIAPSEARLRTIAFRARELHDLANRNERLRGRAGDVIQAELRVRRDLDRLVAENTAARATLAALRLLRRVCERHHVVVAGLSPAASGDAAHDGKQDVGITLHGRYRDVVGTVTDLSRGDVLVGISGALFNSGREDALAQRIDATLQATIYYGTKALSMEAERATIPLR